MYLDGKIKIVNVNPKDKTEYYTLKWRT